MKFLIDRDFDFNDQLAQKYLKYKNEYYDIGTKLKIKTDYGIKEATFLGWDHDDSFKIEGGRGSSFTKYTPPCANNFIAEIINPIYPNLSETINRDVKIKLPELWEIETKLIWYIIIMVGGVIFEERLILWIVATLVFLINVFGGFNKQ